MVTFYGNTQELIMNNANSGFVQIKLNYNISNLGKMFMQKEHASSITKLINSCDNFLYSSTVYLEKTRFQLLNSGKYMF